jgi:hypothetical protein
MAGVGLGGGGVRHVDHQVDIVFERAPNLKKIIRFVYALLKSPFLNSTVNADTVIYAQSLYRFNSHAHTRIVLPNCGNGVVSPLRVQRARATIPPARPVSGSVILGST